MTEATNGGSLRTGMSRKVGPLTLGQILGMLLGALIGLFILNIGGMGRSLIGWLIIAVAVYMVPHLLGLTSPKKKAVYGAVFAVIAIAVGGALVGPDYIDDNSGTHFGEHGSFTQIDYAYEGDQVTVSVTFTGKDGEVPTVAYAPIDLVSFRSLYIVDAQVLTAMTVSGSSATAVLTLDSSQLYYLCVVMATVNDDGTFTADADTASYATLADQAYSGNGYEYTFTGAAFCLLYIMVIFYMILAFSTLMRRKINKARKRLSRTAGCTPKATAAATSAAPSSCRARSAAVSAAPTSTVPKR